MCAMDSSYLLWASRRQSVSSFAPPSEGVHFAKFPAGLRVLTLLLASGSLIFSFLSFTFAFALTCCVTLYASSSWPTRHIQRTLVYCIMRKTFSRYWWTLGATLWRSWLRRCATSRKITGSVPNAVIGTFHWLNPSGCTTVLGSTHPLLERSTRNISCEVEASGA
jgi:hypothetical protein